MAENAYGFKRYVEEMIVYKKNYDRLCENVKKLVSHYGGVELNENMYAIKTPCGKLNVSVGEFSKNRPTWIFTRIEHPEKVSENYRKMREFNTFSGKFNNISYDGHYLISWLYCYLEDLIHPDDYGFIRIPDSNMELELV